MILGVYGLRAIHRNNNVTKMLKRLEVFGAKTKEFRYHKFMVFHTYLLDKIFNVEKKLYKKLKSGQSIIGHSFGCVLLIDLLNNMSTIGSRKKLNNIYFFNPSADKDIKIEESHFDKLFIFYEPADIMLKLAQWLPFNKLGALGKYGYKHKSKKIVNIKLRRAKNGGVTHHDDVFFEPNLTDYSKFVIMYETGTEKQKQEAFRRIKRKKRD